MSLEQYRKSLITLGPEGQKAFVNLATAISRAEVPLKRTSTLMQNLGVTLKNTIKWQLSSTAIHSFMGAIQSAWGYAQDLNESLNNIRIVTGQNIDQMAQFAEKANQAAKALSATTTAYTDASLIYYQQGLEDKQVQERTDTTIKLSNVSRQSVEEVSNQMTAIWNNFYDGTKSLESYADAITALGAATASSSSEIATGIEKFAAVSDTVGLSYEYATAALATVTATTRQSADTVGTAFKTLFARIQDLELGETLEDGTDLGTYSQALQTIGVNIKDSNGELKDMDIILEDIGAKWDTLSKDSQVALAQNVAGVRQYTQFMALMDNWDFMQKNLETVRQSEGTLQEQADIYAESWEAANKRVQTSLQSVYRQLINDEFFIDLTNGIGEAVDGVSLFIDTIGGAKGVLFTLGAIVTNIFNKQIAQSIDNTIYKLKMLTPKGQQQAQEMKYESANFLEQMANEQGNSLQGKAIAQSYKDQASIQRQIIDNANKYSAAEMEHAQTLQQEVQHYGELNAENAKALDLANSELDIRLALTKATLQRSSSQRAQQQISTEQTDINEEIKSYGSAAEDYEVYEKLKKEAYEKYQENPTENESFYKNQLAMLEEMKKSYGGVFEKIEQLKSRQQELAQTSEQAKKSLQAESQTSFDNLINSLKQAIQQEETLKQVGDSLDFFVFPEDIDSPIDETTLTRLQEYANELQNLTTLPEEAQAKVKQLQEVLKEPTGKTEEIRNLVSDLTTFSPVADTARASTNNLKEKLRQFGEENNIASDLIEQVIASLEKQVQAEENAKRSNENYRNKIKQTEETLKQYGQTIGTIGKKIGSIAGFAGNLSMMITSMTSFIRTLNDENASGLEKFTSGLMAFSMMGGSLSSTLDNLGNAVTAFAKSASSAAGSTTLLGRAVGFLYTNALPITGVILGIAAAIGICVAAYSYFSTQEERALKAAQKRAEESKKEVEELTTAYEDLKSSIENIEKASSALDEMTKGTQEWRDSVAEVNQQILELIQLYPELGAAVKNNNGVLELDTESEVYQDYINKKYKELQESTAKNYRDTIDVNTSQNAVDIKDTAKEIGISQDEMSNIVEYSLKNGIDSLYGLTESDNTDIVNELGLVDSNIDNVTDNLSKIISLVASIEGRESSNEILKDYITESDLNSLNNEKWNNLEDNIKQSIIQAYQAQDKVSKADLSTEDIISAAISYMSENPTDEARSQYGGSINAETGKTESIDIGSALNKLETRSSLGVETLIDDLNKVGISIQDLSPYFAEMGIDITSTTEDLDAFIDKIINFQNSLRNETDLKESQISALTNLSSGGDFSQLSDNERSGLTDYINTIFNTNDSEKMLEFAQNLGFETWNEFINAFNEANANEKEINNALVERLDKVSSGVSEEFIDLWKNTLTNDTKEKVVKEFEDTYKIAGEKGVEALEDTLEKGLTDEQINALTTAMGSVDWSSGDGLSQLTSLLAEQGIELDLTTDAWLRYAEAMQAGTTGLGTTGYDKTYQEDMKNIGKVKDLSYGESIDDETYQSLLALNSATKDYFVMSVDGWALIGDGVQLYGDLIQSATDKAANGIAKGKEFLDLAQNSNNLAIYRAKEGELTSSNIQSEFAFKADTSGTDNQQFMAEAVNNTANVSLESYNAALEKYLALRNEANNGTLEGDDLTAFTEAEAIIQSVLDTINMAVNDENAFVDQIINMGTTALSTATSMEELQNITNILNSEFGEGTVSTRDYGLGLLNIAQSYTNCSDEASMLQQAIQYGTEAQQQAAATALELAIAAGEQAENFGLDSEEIEILSENFADLAESEEEQYKTLKKANGELDSDAVTDAAVRYKRLNNAVEDLAENYEDYSNELKKIQKLENKNEKTLALTGDTAKKLKKSLADLINTSEEFIDIDFLDAIDPKDFKAAANGDEAAIRRIQQAFAAAQADALGLGNISEDLKNELAGLAEGQTIELDNSPALQAMIQTMVEANYTADEIENSLSGMGIDCDVTPFTGSMAEAAAAAAAAGDEIVGSLSMDAETNTVTVQNKDTVRDVSFAENVDVTQVEGDVVTPENSGSGKVEYTATVPQFTKTVTPIPVEQPVEENQSITGVKLSNMHKSSGGKVSTSNQNKVNSGSGGGGGGGGGGGSSKPAKKVKKTKFTDLGDRYHTITKQLEDQSRAVEKLSKLEDRLYGASKIKAMERQSKELKKQIELNKQKAEEAKKYLEEDTTELNASVTGFNAQFGTNLTVQLDDEGNITNYREIVEEMQRVSNEWEDHLNSLATQEEQDSEENQEYQEKLDDAISRITDAIDQYEETDQTLEDIEDEMEDLNDQIQQLNFDAWAEKLELVADKFDRYTTLLEHTNKLLGISGDNIYTAAQALTQQVGTPNEDGTFSGGVYGQALDTIKQLVGETAFEAFQGGAKNVFDLAKTDANSAVGELYQKYQNGDINQDQYVEGLKQLQDQFYELGDTIVEIDEYAFTAYRNALEDGKERLERYTKVIDQAANQLDHMNNLLDLIGQQTDYEKKGVVLEGQKEASKANLDAKTSIYDMAKTQWEEVKANWDAMDDKQKEKYKDTYDAALDYYMEASDEWYSAQEDFAEKTKALAENQLALAEKLARESILGEGVSWDAVSDQLDRYSSIGDEYLTKTNQIYKVTKLTRTIQGDIDKTSNTAAKKRLETFKKQTEELAKQEELTEYEMELQNKKYELLLAEIAMEEAQNAKSQVRLTRDSEGNYSYTYTTDEEEMQKAEDEYLQKQNDLYNYLLDGTNDYYTKYVETMREATETFQSINEAYLNGEIETEEEYHRQMLEAQQYYNNLMQTYKNLYNVAMDELGDQAVDSWTTDSGLILDTTVQLNDDVGTEIDGIIGHGTRLDQSYNDFAKQYITYITDEEGKLSEFTTFTETEHGKQQGYWNATQTAINEYYQEIDTNIPIASQDIGDLRKEVEKVGNEAKNQARNIDTLTGSISKQLTEVDKIVTAWDQYADAVEKVREALAALQTDINGGIDAEGGNPEWGPGDGTEEPGDGNPTGGVAPPSGGGDMSGSGKYGDYITVTGHSPNRYFITSSGEKYHLTGTAANGYSGSDPQAAEIQKAWDSYVGKNGYSNSIDWNTNKLDLKVIGLESGGYTGEWDDGSGRLALLHSKELVLNKEDTANMLSSVELIRDLIKVIDLNALATAMNSISALSSNNCAPEQKELEHEKLEQDIHIEANFPNATDKEEILGAFRSLSDLASQYAHRK